MQSFSAILKPGTPLWVRLTAIMIVLLNETLWDGGLRLLLSTAHAQRGYTRAKAAIDRTAGAVMSLFGLRLIWGAVDATRRLLQVIGSDIVHWKGISFGRASANAYYLQSADPVVDLRSSFSKTKPGDSVLRIQ